MVFRDSLQFFPASLGGLTASLAKTGRGNFYNLQGVVSQIYPGSDVEILERKGVFCYDYVYYFARLETPALPPREAFFNKLGGVECSEVDYAHVQQVYANFQCERLKDYMKLYFQRDICLLADVFQMFRNNSFNEYQLFPAYFVSAQQLAWNALVKHINWPIPLITDPELYRMIQPNIQRGICQASIRYARANNKLMGSLYDQKPTSYIMEVNANNLYGWTMSQEMPDGNFEWVSEDEFRNMEQLLNDTDNRIAIFDFALFDHRENEEDKKFYFRGGLRIPT